MNEAPASPSSRGRRARFAAASALVVAVAVALYLVLANNSNGDRNNGTNSAAQYSGSATVQRRNLVEQDTQSGTLGHARSYTVYNRASGTITWLPSAGDVINPGQTLFRVDNKPVLLMDGTTPAYRDLSSSDSPGPDILELNANLVELGYNPDGIVVDDTWQAATTAAVKELQHALGEGESGKILLGKIVFLPGKQLVTSVLGTVGATVSLTDPASHAEFVSLDTTPADTTSTTDPPGTTTTTTPPPTTTTGTTTTPADTTPTTTTPPATTTTPPPTTTTGTTTTPRTTTGTTTTPKTHTNTNTTGRTPTTTGGHHPSTTTTPSSSSGRTPPHSTTVPGGDNLSERTLRALLQLVKEQQQALAHEQSPSHNGSPSTSPHSHSPSSSSHSPSSSSHSPSSSSHSPSSSSHSPSNSSHSPSSSSHSPSSSSHSPSSSSHSPSSSSKSPSSSAGGAGTAIMDTTSTQLVVTVDLSPSSQSEAVVGSHVTVQMPDGSTVPGTISAVSSVAQSSSSGSTGNTGSGGGGGSGGSSSVPVTITLDRHVSGKGLDQAAVSVNFVQARANHVLSVPVTALLATSGSRYAVQEAARPHKLIPVRTGMFAAGYVQISGAGIYPGLQVTDSQG